MITKINQYSFNNMQIVVKLSGLLGEVDKQTL